MTVAKRALDIGGAALGLALLMPVMLIVALAIACSSPGAPLLRQRRAGRGGREFGMWKFRTMVVGAEQLRPMLIGESRDADWLDLESDPRITPLGRLLRRTSLDELPQLVNVLLGDMSLVGPRPLPLEEQARVPAWADVRADVRPGITGLWQVRGRGALGFTAMLLLDCEYVRQATLWGDVKILARTVPAVVGANGAR
ncbi:MAG TPA: sugar transferase [Solirubrobacteraceae bacterium]|jgi:lipopolysaccharide/colanic/teichoic acid biosynthesis glycosyltransferase|nr:sugar transferase [Solirubrobacteraceae bacterium]